MNDQSKLKNLKKKFSLSSLFYTGLILLVVIVSLIPVVFDPSRLQDKKFQANLILNIALTILTYVVAIMDYSTKARIKETFISFVERLISLDRKITEKALSFIFKDYVNCFNFEKRNEYILSEFEKNLISKQFINSDIKIIEKALEENIITKEQYDVIIKCKTNKFHVVQYDVRNMRTYKDYRKSADSVDSNRNSIVLWGIIPKIVYIIVISVLFSSFARDMNNNVIDKFDAILNLVMRLFNIISAIWLGYVQSGSLINDEIRIMEIKIAFLEDFFIQYETGQWKPTIDIEESVREKLEQIDLEYKRKNNQVLNESNNNSPEEDTEIIEVSEEEYNMIVKKDSE